MQWRGPAVLVVLLALAYIGLKVHDAVDRLSVLGEGVRKAGSKVPFVGDPVEDLGRRGEDGVHHLADVLVMELYSMTPDDERFTAKTTVLIENVRHHIEEEEQEWFPQVRKGLTRKQLQEIGEEMVKARKKAPKKPSQPSALKKTIDAVLD